MERPDEAACVSDLSGSASAPCSAAPPHTSVSRRGASVRLVTDSVQLPPRRHPWSPGSVGQGSRVPGSHETATAGRAVLGRHCPQGTIKTLGWNTPQSFWEGSLFGWRGGLWFATFTGTCTDAPKEWRLVDTVFVLCLAPDHSILQRGVYTLLQNPGFCGYCQGPPVLFLALMSSRTSASRCHRTVTSSKEYLNSYHPQDTARGNRPRGSVFPGRGHLANPHSCSWRGF